VNETARAAAAEGLPPAWLLVGVVLVVGAAVVGWVEGVSRRQLRKMDSLWAAARRHQLREHEALMAKLSAMTLAATVKATPARKPVKPADAITVELETIKPEQLRGEWKGEDGDG
jgi:hypothetical protein